ASVNSCLAVGQAAAQGMLDQPDLPINVGVGIHAGETAESDEGYVGSAVNVAARLGSAAGPGEELVSDTVRGLTRTGGEVHYTARGNRRFKGISEPIAVFAASGATAVPTVRLKSRVSGASRALMGAGIAGTTIVVIVAILMATRGAAESPTLSPAPTRTAAAFASPSAATASSGTGSASPNAS